MAIVATRAGERAGCLRLVIGPKNRKIVTRDRMAATAGRGGGNVRLVPKADIRFG